MPGLINFGAGLSAMGSAIADTAGKMGLAQQQTDLESQKLLLADQLQRGRDQAQFAQQDKITDKTEAGATARTQMTEEGANTRADNAETGANTRNADTIAGENKRSADTIAAENKRAAAAIAAGALDTGVDADTGNTMIFNKVTGKSTPLMGMDGKPLNLVNPAQAQLARDVVISTNEQVRAATQQYGIASRDAQKDVSDALKASGGDQKDPDVVAARERQKTIGQQYNESIKSLNDNVAAQVNAALHRTKLVGDVTAPTKPQTAGAMDIPPAYAGKPDGTVLRKGDKNFVIQGGQLVPQ
jgi:hypothetical protein